MRGILRTIVASLILAFSLLQPLVRYLDSYDPADCDDKAVHYFSAMYSRADPAQRVAFHDAIHPFVEAFEQDPWWPRTAFRLQAAYSYPLANLVVAAVHGSSSDFEDSVKWGLLLVTLVAVVVFALVAAATPLGVWPAVVTVNLLAWQVVPPGLLLRLAPPNMLPFLSYAPRSAGCLLVIAAVLAFAAGRRWLFAAILSGVFLWHVGLGLLAVAVVLPGVALASLAARDAAEFHDRALLSSVFVLAMAMTLSAVTDLHAVDRIVQSWTGLALPRQVSLRLVGTEYTLFVLVVVLGARRLAGLAIGRLPSVEWLGSSPGSTVAMAVLVGTIGLGHAASYAAVADGRTGFFRSQCRVARRILLPDNWKELSLRDEQSMFVSFGDYLSRLRRGAGG